MLEDVEDTKTWLQEEERLERRITLIELWENGESEELKEKAGAYYDDFQEMMEILEEEYAKDEITDPVMKTELESEGFETAVALRIVEALDTAEPGGDLTIIKRKTTPEQQGHLMEIAIGYYLGEIGRAEIDEILNNLEMEGSARDLFQRTSRFMLAAVKNSINERGGISALKETVSDRSGYDENRVEKFMRPLENNLKDIKANYVQAKTLKYDEKLTEMNKKIDQILRIVAGQE